MMSAEQIFELYSDSVVFIICHSNLWEGRQGTGFFISDDGYILTNEHVVENCTGIDVRLKDGRELEAQKLWGNPKIDSAIIKVEGQQFKPIPIGNTDEVRIGSKVYVIGNPKGLEWTISEGIVSQIRLNPFSSDKFKIIQTTAPISPGSSGSPLITAHGKVIGIMSWSLKEAQNLNFAVSINDIDPLDKIAKIKSGEISISMKGREGEREESEEEEGEEGEGTELPKIRLPDRKDALGKDVMTWVKIISNELVPECAKKVSFTRGEVQVILNGSCAETEVLSYCLVVSIYLASLHSGIKKFVGKVGKNSFVVEGKDLRNFLTDTLSLYLMGGEYLAVLDIVSKVKWYYGNKKAGNFFNFILSCAS
ncbi:Putative serine protease HtrA [bacterium HR19]|nr:Putative serine protease HtrA [bacterium HR19]